MALAATDTLILEEVQLLADCFAPVFARNIPTAAEELIRRGLLRAFVVREAHTCFLLAVTDEGRSYVETWIERNGKAVEVCDSESRPLTTRMSATWMTTCQGAVLKARLAHTPRALAGSR